MLLDDIPASRLLASMPEPMLVMSSDGIIVAANDALAHLLETDVPPIATNVTQFIPETERERLDPLAWMRRWAESPEAPELEYVHLICRTALGNDRPVRVRVGRLSNDAVYYLVLLHDITQEQAKQHQSRHAHRLAARILANSADAIVNVNAEFTIIYANPSAESLFGYSTGELVDRPLSDLLPGSFQESHEIKMGQFAATSAPARLMGERAEVVGVARDGEEIPLEASICKVTLDQALVYSAQLRDLRSRKAAQAELARSMASFHTVFDHALQAMALLSPEGLVLEINPAAMDLLPSGQRVLGLSFSELPFWSADPDITANRLRDAMTRCQRGGIYRSPVTMRMPDGSERQLDFSLTPVTEEGEIFAMVAEARELGEAVPPGA
jgi:PAS domain S-box-containing protein